MAIDEDTLEEWTSYQDAAITSAKTTHTKLRNALDESDVLSGIEFETYLQGSYANHTIIPETSDVDIVARMDEYYFFNYHDLDPDDQEDVEREDFEYSHEDFRSDVVSVLEERYPSGTIDPTGNAVSIKAPGLDLCVDILVCVKYQYYYNYPQGYYEGIVFQPTDSFAYIINYPNRHLDHGSKKHDSTDDRYKETVRLFKNARNVLIEEGYIWEGLAPSYFIECLLYNVPPGRYDATLQDRFRKIVNYLREVDFEDWKCQNGVTPLFGSGRTSWDSQSARVFIEGLWTYWEEQGRDTESLAHARLLER